MTWGEIGQLMSGAGVLMTSLCAGVTVTIISRYQKRRHGLMIFELSMQSSGMTNISVKFAGGLLVTSCIMKC
jgi:hypothetical protein